MKPKHLILLAGILAAVALTGCSEEENPSTVEAPRDVTPRDMERVVENLEDDLLRVLSITEALETEEREMVRRILDDGSFRDLIAGHLDEVEGVAEALRNMSEADRLAFAGSVKGALGDLSLRMNAVYSTGPAAEDAFAPLFEDIMDELRGML